MGQNLPNRQDFVDRAYLEFMIWQCQACYTSLDAAANAQRDDRTNIRKFFMHLHSALIFADGVSRMLWPRTTDARYRQRAEDRAARLQTLIGIQSNPVLEDLAIRNRLEHLDEDLDEWAQVSGTFIAFNTIGSLTGLGAFYDWDGTTFSSAGKEVNPTDLSTAVLLVMNAAWTALRDVRSRLP